ncbi:MAG: pilus assembly protein PilM [Candidatus Omnitrophica bacterium]|nr:pilus assembly protein PilM [Candidatus Omnitrophota bacterium]
MKKDLLTTVEITDSHVKIYQSRGAKTGSSVGYCEVRALRSQSDEEISNVLIESRFPKNISKDKLTVVLPRKSVILKQIKLPSHDFEEIKKMVALQLVSLIPYALDEVVYDFHVLEKDSGGYTKVLVVVVNKDVCRRYINIFQRAGVVFDKFVLSSLGMLQWLQHQQVDIKMPSVFVDVDYSHCEIGFVYQKTLLFSRSINYGAKDFSSDNMLGLIDQLQRSLAAYHKEGMGSEPQRIFLIINVMEKDALKERLEREFKKPVEILSGFEKFSFARNVNINQIRNQGGVSLAVGLGMLLKEPQKMMSLFPAEIQEGKRIKGRRRSWVIFFLLLLINLGLFSVLPTLHWQQKEKYLKQLENEIQSIKPQIEEEKKKKQFVEIFYQELKRRIIIVDLIHELNKLTPNDISFRSLLLDDNGSFTIQGYAQTSTGVNDFQSRLVRSAIFNEVNLQFATKRKIFNMEVTDFKIISKLKIKE